MSENQSLIDSTESLVAGAEPDRVTRWFLLTVALAGLVYVCFGLTPSSYGVTLEQLHAPEGGPVAGTSRFIRMDEWGLATPYFQATVRNRFQRVNETSLYREDLRNFLALPLKDWSLPFKPQLWAFFLFPPATAYSIYFGLLMCACLAGYHLLFRRLGVPAWLAASTAVTVYFAGFTQFWWTTYGPLLVGLPWLLLIVFSSMQWWKKALLCMWAFPALVFAHVYPTLLVALAWGALILILAVRPSLLRSPGDLAALAAGVIAAAVVVYAYYADVIPIMRNTFYPGHRISPSGGTSIFAVLSEIFPFITFRLDNYQPLTGPNICEIGAVGSFLPLLTLCLTRYRSLRDHALARDALLILLAGFSAITAWEIATVPAWIGRILFWDTGSSERWMFTSGLLLIFAALVVWSNQLISLHPFRIALFVLIGPVASFLLKVAWLIRKGDPVDLAFDCPEDMLICGLVLAAGLAACFIPAPARVPLLSIAIALANIYAFARFNPLQPAKPIFQVPETDIVRDLRKEAAASPERVLTEARFYGATLNGLGFRSVNHILLAPRLAVFRQYFPNMDEHVFNVIFNRYAMITPGQSALPSLRAKDLVEVPAEVFAPIRNVRQLALGPALQNSCSQPSAGGIDRVSAPGDPLTIEGWAPWSAETDAQGIRVLSARPLRPGSLSTVSRPDIADRLRDYRFVKSGFKVHLSSVDGKPLRPEELVLFAFGTSQGEIRLSCCGCQ